MKLLVGLGNPGQDYLESRHNFGFLIIDLLANKLNFELNKQKFNGLYYQNKDYILLKPQTYMNNSGECILSFMNYFQISINNLIVIYDDIALPLGVFLYRQQGSDGGHNGIKNIIEKLGEKKFNRLRLGIGYDKNFLIKDWVLGKFLYQEKEEIKKIIPILLDSLLELIKENNFERIMNNFNKKKN